MRYRMGVAAVTCMCTALASAGVLPTSAEDKPDVIAARKARDQGDITSLRKLIDRARSDAQLHNTASDYERLAQFELWLCEAGHRNNDDPLIKRAAEGGVAAAERAVALNPNSSEAYRLEGDSLGELIPVSFAGGMRYGSRSSSLLDKAIELDAKNADAYVARAVSYLYTPAAFGGSREKAIQFLKKAVEINPSSDIAHIWLAQIYLGVGQHDDALREINEALRLDPDRGRTKFVYTQIASALKQNGSAH